ncbi:MAG: serine--tRNA ligase [candidate division SR1 bacterium]|nr:serine--tRNA ligase [candidate division SR1 bacterium]
MIDLKKVRDDIAGYKLICKNKKKDVDVDLIIKLDDERKELQQKVDELKFKQRQLAEKKDYDGAKALKVDVQQLEDAYVKVEEQLNTLLLNMPNFYHPDTPIGIDEAENIVTKTVGDLPKFDFPAKDHEELGKLRDIIDKETAAIVSGARFTYIKGDLVLMQMGIVKFVFDTLGNSKVIQGIIKERKLAINNTPFIPILPPVIMSMGVMEKMGRLHPMDERYCLHEDKQVLVGSAEHTMGSMYMDRMFEEKELPVRMIGYSTAFRREAGTYGKDVKGIIRVHQFDKMEMETFSTPETGGDEQELIIGLQEYMMQKLGLPYRVVECCTGDMGDIDYRHVDIETYMAGQGTYRETHTSDWMTDYQARRLNTRVKREDGTKECVHMNDATAFAMGRIMVAIIENNQQADGTIKIPEVLVPYMGKKFIGK